LKTSKFDLEAENVEDELDEQGVDREDERDDHEVKIT